MKCASSSQVVQSCEIWCYTLLWALSFPTACAAWGHHILVNLWFPLFFGNFTKAGNSAAAAQGCNFQSNTVTAQACAAFLMQSLQAYFSRDCGFIWQWRIANSFANYISWVTSVLLPAILDMTHLKLVKTVTRKTHPQVCANNGGWVNSCCACVDHSRSRPSSPNLTSIGRLPGGGIVSALWKSCSRVRKRNWPQGVATFPYTCPACQNRLAECRSSAAAAIIVDLAAIVEKQHVALRRRCPSCPDFGVLLAQLQCPCRAALFSWKASRLPLLHAIFCFWL